MSIVELSRTPNLVIPEPVELHANNPAALPQGYPISDRFTVQELVDKRARSTIYRVADHVQEDDAVLKIITEHNPAYGIHTEREFAAMAVLVGKPRVAQARAFGSLQIKDATHRYIVMDEYGASLASRIKDGIANPVETAISVGISVGLALDAMHTSGLVHGDVGPQNIHEDGDSFRLIDFGGAEIVASPDQRRALERRIGGAATKRAATRTDLVISTRRFTATERFKGRSEPSSDIYSLAQTLRTILSKEGPETDALLGDTVAFAPNPQAKAEQQSETWKGIEMPEELEAAIVACTSRDPQDRLSAIELVKTLLPLPVNP